MNRKILEQIKGGAFLAGDLPMSTSSFTFCTSDGRSIPSAKCRTLGVPRSAAFALPRGDRAHLCRATHFHFCVWTYVVTLRSYIIRIIRYDSSMNHISNSICVVGVSV
jgi:hypothetical protein